MGATGLGRTGFAPTAGLQKGEEGQTAAGGEEGDSCQHQEQWRGRGGKQGGAGALSRSVGTWAEPRKHVRLNGFPSISTELMPPVEAAEENWESHFWGQDRASVGLLGQGVRNCQAASIFKVMTNPGSFVPGGIKRLGPQIRCVPACVCDLMYVSG